MILSLILTIVWLVFAGIVLFTEPRTTDNLIRFYGYLILSAVWNATLLIINQLKNK